MGLSSLPEKKGDRRGSQRAKNINSIEAEPQASSMQDCFGAEITRRISSRCSGYNQAEDLTSITRQIS